jgi:hypothetical protein
VVAVLALAVVTAATAVAQSDVLVSTGDPYPAFPFSQNKQNEPAVAIDAAHPNIVAAGSNDEIDLEACNAGPDNDCPFTEGVGVSGIYFSSNSGAAWHQPTYTGWSARHCQGVAGVDTDTCEPDEDGPIGTLPRYDEAGLVADGDPALAFGPVRGANGRFSWTNGSRLYYANLASHLPEGPSTFKGAEAIAVSRTDNVAAAAGGAKSAWMRPVIASRQSSAQFSDKEQIWADNAESSRFFGNVYICYADFRGNGNGFTNQPLMVVTSTNGGNTWTQHQVTSATNNISSRNGFGRSGCTVRTDSTGVVYVFTYQFGFDPDGAAPGKIQMVKSTDGGKHWGKAVNIFTAFDTCNYFEPSIGRCVMDGVAGARSDLSPAPSVDIANGAPEGRPSGSPPDRIVISWVDGRDGLNHEHVMFSSSTNGGSTWDRPPRQIERAGDRGYYSAPSISPNGRDVWVVYNAFTTPFKDRTDRPTDDRQLVGVVLHAGWPAGASAPGGFTQRHRGVSGDARGSSQNDLAAEFLGDYVYSAATNTYSMSVWNDVRNAQDCPAVDEYRQELHDEAVETGQRTAEPEEPRGAEDRGHESEHEQDEAEAPAPQVECPPPGTSRFGNSDIFGISLTP